MSQPLRFVQASDFHLERPLSGLAEIPAHLVDLLIDAPYAAAERVFELAQSERADFLVLAGDIVNVDRAGPRAIAFLLDQFARLAAREIAVYWLPGPAERRGPWPSEIKLPANVHVFARGATEMIPHHADGDDLALLVGYGAVKSAVRPEAAAKNKTSRFTIGVMHGAVHARQLGKLGCQYWACGGPHRRQQARGDRQLIVAAGSPQGRSPAERGPHGAVVVEVDDQGTARARFTATDLARFLRVRVEIDPAAPRADQEHVMAERVQAALDLAPGLDVFLRWQIVPGAHATTSAGLGMSREAWGAAWLRWLRQEFGTDSPAAWSISVDVAPPHRARHASSEDGSLLADFLATVAQAEQEHEELPLEHFVPEGLRQTHLGDLLRIDDAPARNRVLREARLLGQDLLGAEEISA